MGARPWPLTLHGLGLTCVHWLRTVQLPRPWCRGAVCWLCGCWCPLGSSLWAPWTVPLAPLPSDAPALGLCVIALGQLTLHPAHKLGGGVHYPPPGSAMSPTDLGEHLLSPSSLAPLLSHQWGCTAVSSGLWARSCLAPPPASSTVPSSWTLHLPQDRIWGLLLLQWV